MNNGQEQLQTHFILDNMLNSLPKNALVAMAITAKDLYPDDNWNFVFGEANTEKRKAVSSIFRYADAANDSLNNLICLERLIKTSAHEIGHIFKCMHCTHADCVMNGSNSLPESDAAPNALCSVCLKKLSGLLGFNNRLRYIKANKVAYPDFDEYQKNKRYTKSYHLFDKTVDDVCPN
jgi:archaemetzincin